MPGQNKIRVNFYASLRKVAGHNSVEFHLPAPVSVRDLIRKILVELPGLKSELINDQGELAPHINFLVNGRNVCYLDGDFDNLVADGDQVSLFPALGGG